MPARNLQKSSQTRLFFQEDRANPASRPSYQSLGRALGVSWPQGDITPIRVPDPAAYGQFITVDSIRGQQGLPTLSIEIRLTRELSEILTLVRKGCALDLQLHAGLCEDPRDFNGGWEKIYILEGAIPTSYDTGELGALDADQNAVVNETIAFTGTDYYELKRLVGSELASSEIVQQVVDIIICDSRQCGECGVPSDGCQVFFAVTMSAGGSPGLPAEIIYSSDGGGTIGQTSISTLGASEDPTGIACVGIYVVVISNESLSAHYAAAADIINGTESWTEVAVGFVAAKGPNGIFSLGSTFTWAVGDGGYIYFSGDITGGFEVQSAGAQSVQNLNAVHGSDELNLVAVGAANTVIYTQDGGDTWAAVTGPSVGVALTSVFVKDANTWLVGTAGGKLFYTRNGGGDWTEKAFPNSGSGTIRDIEFSTPAIGYMAHDYAPSGARGRILRTIDGGFSWYVLPEQAGQSLPLNDAIYALATCGEDPNLVIGGGLGDNAVDGILVRVA